MNIADAFKDFTSGGEMRHGLPAAAYTSEECYALESERVFARGWVFVGFAHEMAQTGDVVPVVVGGRPVVLVRGEDGALRAFHNVCRHRCLQLVAAAGNARRGIRCPYHSWTYALDGALRRAPYFGGVDDALPSGFSAADNGLAEVRCASWWDWIFVNLDASAAPFEEFIAPLAERLAGVELDALRPVTALDMGVVKCNWKFLMENFIEPYHVQFVHSTTTEQPLAAHAAFADRHCLGCTVALGERKNRPGGATLAVDSNYLTLFPNFVLATYAPDQLGVHLNAAVGVSRTRQRRMIYLLREPQAGEAEALRELWQRVHLEDHAMCERLQLGRESAVAAAGGWLSPHWESSVRRFQELVYDALRRD